MLNNLEILLMDDAKNEMQVRLDMKLFKHHLLS